MILRPFFSFYGSKWQAAGAYPSPLFGTIHEPFAGSAGYSLRYPDRRVILSDADEYIVGVWNYLIGTSAAELLRLPDVAAGQSVDDLTIPQEAKWLIGFWLNNGASSPRKRLSSNGRRTTASWATVPGKPRPLFWGVRVRERLAVQVDSIRHWKCIHSRYEDLDIAAPRTWFIDPPYLVAGKHYRYRISDYPALGKWCLTLTGQSIVCEGPGADWLPFADLGQFRSNRAKTGRSFSHERVWLSP